MNELIERYIYDVKRRLNNKQKEEIEKELRTNIYDMLENEESEENVKKVLLKLGSPAKLAQNYQGERYLISPAVFDDYLRVLKIVLVVLSILHIIGETIGIFFSSKHWTDALLDDLIMGFIHTLFFGFGAVTLIFIGIENFRKKKDKEFKVENLPKVPQATNSKKVRKDLLADMIVFGIFTTLSIVLLLINYINYNINTEVNFIYKGPVINPNLVKVFVPVYIAYVVIALTLKGSIYKKGEYATGLLIVYSAIEFAFLITLTALLSNINVFAVGFVEALENLTQANIAISLPQGVKGVVVVIWLLTILHLGLMWYKKYKKTRL